MHAVPCTLMSNGNEASKTAPPRTLLYVGLIALIVIIAAFATVAWKGRTVPFSKTEWEKGRGQFTKDNPRLRMRDEVLARLRETHIGVEKVQEMLGPPDEPFFLKTPDRMITSPWDGTKDAKEINYILGLRPKSPTQPRALLILKNYLDSKNRIKESYIHELQCPPGSSVVPADVSYENATVSVKPGVEVPIP